MLSPRRCSGGSARPRPPRLADPRELNALNRKEDLTQMEIEKVGVARLRPDGPRDRADLRAGRLGRRRPRGRSGRARQGPRRRSRSSSARAVEKGKPEQADADAVRARIQGTLDYADLADCDLVIEAITEDLDAQARDVARARRHRQGRGLLRHQHLLAAGGRPGGGDQRGRAVPRPALLQSRRR